MKFPYLKLRGKLAPIVPIELKGREWVSYDAYAEYVLTNLKRSRSSIQR